MSGALYALEIDFVGKLVAGELAVVALAGAILWARGAGRHADFRLLRWVLAAGLLMLAGFAASDLVSGTEPWQYLRGWARVTVLVGSAGALIVIASQSPKNLWWLALGFAAATLGTLVATGVAPERWKLGYAEPLALVVVTLGALAPAWLAAAGTVAFGVLSVVLDYRSLGAALVLVGATLLARRSTAAVVALGVACVVVVAAALVATEEQFADRRVQSNATRFAMLSVAARAIADSPVLGLGSWTADPRYTQLIREQERIVSEAVGRRVWLTDSLIPHSQFVQAWLEGGLAAALFFGFYGAHLVIAALWLARRHVPGPVTPLYLFAVYMGLWNLVGSPFLGITRFYIALALAVIAVLAVERRAAERPQGTLPLERLVARSR